jgi:two-component system, cell cycle sensor histidine kinase and response regulator CckA
MPPTNFVMLCTPLVELLPLAVLIWRIDDFGEGGSVRLVGANRAAEVFLGPDPASQIGKSLSELFPSVAPEGNKRLLDVVRSGVGGSFGELRREGIGGGHAFSFNAVPLPDQCVAVLAEDLTTQRREQQEVHRLNDFLDAIVENLPAMLFMKDAEKLRFERFNRAGEELLGVGRDKLIGKTDFDFFPKEQAEFFQAKDRAVLRAGKLEEISEEPIDTAHGRRWLQTRKIPIVEDGVPKHLLGISFDITERRDAQEALKRAHAELESRVESRTSELAKSNAELSRQIEERVRAEASLHEAEEQLRQSQKMDAIGRLAGGVAHDFNNLLSVILSYCAMLMEDLPEGNPLRPDVAAIQMAGDRAADLTRQLLAFSRRQVLSPRVVDLNEVVAGMHKILERILGEDVALTTSPARGLGMTKLDPGQIQQIILNLAVNARDAMPNGGKLTLETDNVVLDDAYAREHLGVSPGPHVMLAVSDTGEGMDKATQARIFEPFFTTKEIGKGTGLGLSTVFGIVQQSGGSIWVYSEPGNGTSFKLYFPMAPDEADAREAEPALPGDLLRGTETILLVEDEAQVRAVVRGILKRQGYQVLDAGNATEGLLLCERFSGVIHMLVTDVVMPQMSGRELAERINALRPEIRILYMSGYTDNTIVHHGVLDAGIHFLQKPITPATLARKVREVLDAPL